MADTAALEVLDSDILTTEGLDVWVSVWEDNTVGVSLIDRSVNPAVNIGRFNLPADAAHELGNKLRLAASRLR